MQGKRPLDVIVVGGLHVPPSHWFRQHSRSLDHPTLSLDHDYADYALSKAWILCTEDTIPLLFGSGSSRCVKSDK